MFTPLNKAAGQKKDFDVVGKIVSIQEKDEYTNELRIRDASGQSWWCQVLKLKFPHLQNGDAIRIRSALSDDTASQKKVLLLSHYSNILTFISHSKLGKDISKINDDKKDASSGLKSNLNLNPVNVSEVDKKYQNWNNTGLHDLFHYSENDPELSKNTTFRTNFQVMKIEPSDVKEWAKSYDKKSNKATSLKSSKGGQAIWQVSLIVKDASTQLSNNSYRILVYSHDGLGKEFFGINADNFHSNAGGRKKLEDIAGLLTKFNSRVDAVVERRGGYYFIKDTKIVA